MKKIILFLVILVTTLCATAQEDHMTPRYGWKVERQKRLLLDSVAFYQPIQVNSYSTFNKTSWFNDWIYAKDLFISGTTILGNVNTDMIEYTGSSSFTIRSVSGAINLDPNYGAGNIYIGGYSGTDTTDVKGVLRNNGNEVVTSADVEWHDMGALQGDASLNAINATFNDSVVGSNVYFGIQDISGQITFASGQIKWCAIELKKKSMIKGVEYYMHGGNADFVGKDFNGVVWFSVDASTGIITQELITDNDPNIWMRPVGLNRAYFTSEKEFDAGIYYVAVSYAASSVTLPPYWKTFDASTDINDRAMYFLGGFNLNFFSSGITDVPSTVDLSDVGEGGTGYSSANSVIFLRPIGY